MITQRARDTQILRAPVTGDARSGSASAILVEQWTHIAVVFNSDTSCNLYINGVLEDTEWVVNPDMLLGSNDFTTGEAYSIGRDWSGNLFAGDVEDIRFYNVALTQAEIENELRRTGDVIGAFYYNSPQDFDGTTTTAESGVHNGLERALEASIYPDTSDDVSYYEGILDCTDETNSGFEGSGFGLDNREILAARQCRFLANRYISHTRPMAENCRRIQRKQC